MLKTAIATLALVATSVFAGPKVAVDTNLGRFVVELNQEKAPVSVENFLKYVDDGSYVNSQFHRVIPGFMAQGGGFAKDFKRLPTYAPIENEASNGLDNDAATIAWRALAIQTQRHVSFLSTSLTMIFSTTA